MFFSWLAPGASALSRFASSQLASVAWCQFAIRIASIRCCKTWLAQADWRAIWIVSMAEEFIRKREPRNIAQFAVSDLHSVYTQTDITELRCGHIIVVHDYLG